MANDRRTGFKLGRAGRREALRLVRSHRRMASFNQQHRSGGEHDQNPDPPGGVSDTGNSEEPKPERASNRSSAALFSLEWLTGNLLPASPALKRVHVLQPAAR
jgi:hypothetical protein